MAEAPDTAESIAHQYVHCYASEHAGQPHSSDCAGLTRQIRDAIKEAEARGLERAAKIAEQRVDLEERLAENDGPGNINLYALRLAVWDASKKIAASIRALAKPDQEAR